MLGDQKFPPADAGLKRFSRARGTSVVTHINNVSPKAWLPFLPDTAPKCLITQTPSSPHLSDVNLNNMEQKCSPPYSHLDDTRSSQSHSNPPTLAPTPLPSTSDRKSLLSADAVDRNDYDTSQNPRISHSHFVKKITAPFNRVHRKPSADRVLPVAGFVRTVYCNHLCGLPYTSFPIAIRVLHKPRNLTYACARHGFP
jgi:hypothetical protein